MNGRTFGIIVIVFGVIWGIGGVAAFIWSNGTIITITVGASLVLSGLSLVLGKRRPVPNEPYRTPPVGEGPYD